MATIHNFPNEVLLQFFPHFCLKSLITGRGVCKLWKILIRLADIHPSRRRLLLLYKRLMRSPAFLPTRPWTLANLRPFDRQAYIDELLRYRVDGVPEEFRFWVLEWPARAAINCVWPGLPSEYCMRAMLPLDRNQGFNVLGYSPRMVDPNPSPSVYVLEFNYAARWHKPCEEDPEWDSSDEETSSDVPGAVSTKATTDAQYTANEALVPEEDVELPEQFGDVPALLVHRDWNTNTWLILDFKRELPSGVYALESDEEKYHGYGYYEGEEIQVFTSWISWLHVQLSSIELRVQHNNRGAMASGESTPPPVSFKEWPKVVV